MSISKVARTAIVLAALAGGTAPAWAADEHNVVPGLSIVGAPLAVHGYDPVAYFTDGQPVRGSDTLVHVHEGVAYRFASQAHLDTFKADPARYAPQYGGFCAYGVSVGKKFDGDPHQWTISDGKLYLNLNEEIAATFHKDVGGNIRKADGNWPRIEHTAAHDL
jgi:YHS domain-containing protein